MVFVPMVFFIEVVYPLFPVNLHNAIGKRQRVPLVGLVLPGSLRKDVVQVPPQRKHPATDVMPYLASFGVFLWVKPSVGLLGNKTYPLRELKVKNIPNSLV